MVVTTGARSSTENLAQESAIGVIKFRQAELADGETSITAANDLAAALEVSPHRIQRE